MKTVVYRSTQKLDCSCNCSDETVDVIICVDESLTALNIPYIDATLTSTVLTGQCNGEQVYSYYISYLESYLLNPSYSLLNADIKGVICKGCFTDWAGAQLAPSGCYDCANVPLCVYSTFYPECFGAKGDGVTDDYAAINAALSAALASGVGGTVMFSSHKRYKTSGTIRIPITARNITLTGYGATIVGAVNGPIIKIADTTTVNDRAEHIDIKGLTIEGSGWLDIVYPNQIGVEIDAVIQVAMKDVYIKNIPSIGILGIKSPALQSAYWNIVSFDHVSVRFCGGKALDICTTSAAADDLTIINCLLNNAGHKLTTAVSEGGVDLNVGGSLTVLGTEVSAMFAPVGGYIWGMHVRQASGILAGVHYENNGHDQVGSADLFLDTDCWGLNVIGSSHAGATVEGAKTCIRSSGKGNCILGVGWFGGPAHTYDYIVDVGNAQLAHVENIYSTTTPAFGPNIMTVVRGGFGSSNFESIDAHLKVGRRREIFETKYAQTAPAQIVLSAGWGASSTVGSVTAYDSHGDFTVHCLGAGQTPNPTITITFADGVWPAEPTVIVVQRNGGNFLPVSYVIAAGVLTIGITGTPTSNNNYVYSWMIVGN